MEHKENILSQQEELNPVEVYVNELKEKNNSQKNNSVIQEEKPDYLLPQFKNIEEQAKSYKELQALQTKQAQELAKYKQLEAIDSNKNLLNEKMFAINKRNLTEENKIKNIYKNEMTNLQMALKSGKINQKEAEVYSQQLKNFVSEKLNDLSSQYKMACDKCGNEFDMLSPKEFFKNEVAMRNYLAPISEFLEEHYKKMSKTELEGVKNLIGNLENSLRDEILNEVSIVNENMNYRNNLNSATNLNPQKVAEKIYTLAEIKNMKPEEFRKNRKAILEQFTTHKIK